MSKKTVEGIVYSGNDYVITVKANQKRLYQQIQNNTQNTVASSIDISTETVRDRFTTRTVSVFDDLTGISDDWVAVKHLVKVERIGTRAGKPYHQICYYISSLSANAAEFAQGIRQHWGIENRLHWVKDVVLNEDHSPMRQGNAPANLSVIRSWAVAILRSNGFDSITKAQRILSHDLKQIFLLLQ